ncbi:MAG: flagellar type III secretion system pore protein FliP [Chitinispirillia bacterium]|nr:flagellar type III secretion system pore protein FliP [Chitinispirillia bacterium]MCL2242348.1 flagellar type III secretion system pore protein FliP [Chitinispirillia bacterium]
MREKIKRYLAALAQRRRRDGMEQGAVRIDGSRPVSLPPEIPDGRIPALSLSDIQSGNLSMGRRAVKIFTPLRAAMFTMSILVVGLFAYLSAQNIPSVTLSLANANNPGEVSTALQVLFLITVLALAPSILIMTTSFIRIIIVLSFLRRALGTQTLPPDQLMVGLALFMTLFVMMPVITEINDKALQPYLAEEIKFNVAVEAAVRPVRNFMLRQVSEKDVALFVRISRMPPPRTVDDLPLEVVIPAFITSELKTGFIIGFILFIPFLVIDMVVASVLLSMGMMMLPPTMIAMPFKIILFVLVDGWHLLVRQLIVSFR